MCAPVDGFGRPLRALRLHTEKLARWAELGVTEVLFGLPDKSEAEVAGYVERLAGKLAALV